MKTFFKTLANALSLLLILPPYLAYACGSLLFGRQRTFAGWSQGLSLIPGIVGVYLRRAFYRLVLPYCAGDACLSFGVVISHPSAKIGRRAYVGICCSLGDVTLEDDVLVASHVSIVNGPGQHGIDRLDVPIREQPGVWTRVTIGRDSWIGERAVIMADVGKHCVIGAGSVVTKPVPDFAIAVGVPAKVFRFRNDRAGEARLSPTPNGALAAAK